MGTVTAGLTGVELVRQDPWRVSLHVENRSATATVFIDRLPPEGITTSNAGIRIGPNEFVDVTLLEDGLIVKERWSVVSDTAGVTVGFDQGYLIGVELPGLVRG